jgi:hypothetical protein
MFDKRLNEAIEHFAIVNPEDWQNITATEVQALPNFGPQFVNYLRLHLANCGLTLKDDETPAYWQSHLGIRRGAMGVSNIDKAVVSEFVILIDTGEQMPFTFQGFRADGSKNNAPLVVRTKREPLGTSRGDYCIEGMHGWCHVERKSCQDAISTVLGFGEHRDNFIKTLSFLAEIPSSCVMVECDRDAMLESCVPRGKKSKNEMMRTLNRQIMAWEDDFRVPWIFSRNRRTAEYRTLWWLQRSWKHRLADLKQAQKVGS